MTTWYGWKIHYDFFNFKDPRKMGVRKAWVEPPRVCRRPGYVCPATKGRTSNLS